MEFHGAIGEVMTLKAFREQIAVEIQSAGIGAPPGTLTSVEPGRMPPTAPSDAAPPSLAVDEVTPPLLPSEREDTPRRIKPGPEGADE